MSELQPFESKFPQRRLRFCLGKNDGGAWGEDPDGLGYDKVVLRSTDQGIGGAWQITNPALRLLSEQEFKKTRLRAGDLLITKSSGSPDHIGKTSVVTDEIESLGCSFSNFMQRLRPHAILDSQFLAYILNTNIGREQFRYLSTTTTGLGNLSAEIIADVRIPLPAITEQRTIAEFVRRETARMDALVAGKQLLLALLNEKRRAFTFCVVTRGLNPRVRMKDSGHTWLGEVPVHWDVKRTKRVFSERDDRSEFGEEELLTVSHITGVTKRSEKDVNMFEAETTEGYKLCSPGNLVINTLWAWMGAMGIAMDEGIVSPAYHVYDLSDEILPGYVEALVSTPAFIKEITRFSTGVWSSRLRLYPEGLFEVRIPVPPLEEQEAIVAAISGERARTADLELALKQSIALLEERRAALIAAAVTGQIPMEEVTQ